MAAKDAGLVKIERGKFSPYFQVARAWLTAASALASHDQMQAVHYINGAIEELEKLKRSLHSVGGV